MLKQRILTAVVLVPIALAVVLAAPLWMFDVAVVLVMSALAAEYAALVVRHGAMRALFVLLTAGLIIAAVAPLTMFAPLRSWLLIAAVCLWFLAPLWFIRRQRLHDGLKALLGLVLLAGAGIALHEMKAMPGDGLWVLLAFLLVWGADIGGYAFGRLYGRHKLAPSISPGKTWEGFLGGMLSALLIGAAAGSWMLGISPNLAWLAVLVLVTVASVVGDLVESLLKRQAGVKDSGRLLPGHGGVFDRLDSLLAAAPVLLLGTKIGIFGGISEIGT